VQKNNKSTSVHFFNEGLLRLCSYNSRQKKR